MIDIKGLRIALVGGAGFIGHNLALELKRQGADVSIIDSLQINNLLYFTSTNLNIANRDLYTRILQQRLSLLRDNDIKLYVQDARDYHALSKILNQEVKAQVVIVLAAVSHASRSNKDPYSTFDHSFRTLENSLDNSRNKIDHLIYFSSSMVYGNFATGTVTEESPCEPIGIYGALKYSGEKLVIAYNQVFDLPYTIVRPSALYGERCVSRRVGQIFIENALQGKEIIVKGDGSDSLDFTYIDDLVSGIVKCIKNKNARNQIFNLTYGQGRSLHEMAEILRQHFPEITIKNVERDGLMPERGTLCVDKAKELIGYDPQNPLEIGFTKYIEWYKKFSQKYSQEKLDSAQVYE